jgi:hypothetical protein
MVAVVLAVAPLPAQALEWRGGARAGWRGEVWEAIRLRLGAVAAFLKLGPGMDPDGVTGSACPAEGCKPGEVPDLGPDMDPDGRD